MRQLRFVGVTADGGSLVVERDGEHLVLPVDDDVRAAVTGQLQMPMPLASSLTPREIQRRIRAGESAERIAGDSGVPVERVARFEGPVLAEREHHVEQARRTVVDDISLGERILALDPLEGTIPDWDSWLADDGIWRVRATWPDGRTATWSWEPATRRLRPLDAGARSVHEGDVPHGDDLEAVLRPVASSRHVSLVPDRSAEVRDDRTADPGEEPEPHGETEPPAAAAAKRRRASVPSWDEIFGGRPPGGTA